jgi:hypothetical protein
MARASASNSWACGTRWPRCSTKSGFPWLTITQKAYTNQNDRVKIVRHAVAIDERRTYFQPSLWEPGRTTRNGRKKSRAYEKRPQDFEEVWFTGCHGDVGGGYPDKKSGLAKIPFEWLYREAVAAGVAGDEEVFDLLTHGKDDAPVITGEARDEAEKDTKRYGAPDPLADINNSMNFAWGFVEFLPRKVPGTSFYRISCRSARSISRCSTTAAFRRAPSCTKR